MKTNLSLTALVASALLLVACQGKFESTVGSTQPGSQASLNSNITVLQAAQSLTDGIFAKEAPVVTSAIKNLPLETQTFAQAAFALLQKGIDQAEAVGWNKLSATDQALATGALSALLDVQASLHEALHNADAVIPPTLPLQDSNGLLVAIPVPSADPKTTATIDPNSVVIADPSTILSIDPNSKLTPVDPLSPVPTTTP